MLDFLLVLGQVPGTSFVITFNEIAFVLCIAFLIWEERRNHKALVRWLKWLRYRSGVNYRRRKRMLRTYIKQRRYRLAMFERRIIRQSKTFLRRQRHALFMVLFYRRYSSIKRRYYKLLVKVGRLERRTRRSKAFQNLQNIKVRRPA